MANKDRVPKQARPVNERLMRFLIFLALHLPRRVGYFLTDYVGPLAALLSPRRRAILERNLAVVLDTDNPRRLRRVAAEACGTACRAYYELFYLPTLSDERVIQMLEVDEPGEKMLHEALERGRGAIVVATHQSSFDLLTQSMCSRGFPVLLLALPDEIKGFEMMNEIRMAHGVQVMPVGPRALREALRVLRRGEIVATGGDRPIKDQGTVVEFFGQPTLLPDGHVRLAMHAGAPLFAVMCRREKGRYHARFVPVEMTSSGDEEEAVRDNVQRLARVLEAGIREHPEQWHMFRQLWEEGQEKHENRE